MVEEQIEYDSRLCNDKELVFRKEEVISTKIWFVHNFQPSSEWIYYKQVGHQLWIYKYIWNIFLNIVYT